MNDIDYIIILNDQYTKLLDNCLYFKKINPSLLDLRLITDFIINPESNINSANFLNIVLSIKEINYKLYNKILIIDSIFSEESIDFIKNKSHLIENGLFNLNPLCIIVNKKICDTITNRPIYNEKRWFDNFSFYESLLVLKKQNIIVEKNPWDQVFM